MDGLELLDKIMEIQSETPVIMISGHGTIETAVEAIKKGAYDFMWMIKNWVNFFGNKNINK